MSEQVVRTKGNINVNEIEVGDTQWECDYGRCIEVEVKTKPIRDDNGHWTWISIAKETGAEINYSVTEGYSAYAPKLYNYKAYV